MRAIYFFIFLPLLPLVSARALSPIERIALLARQERPDGNDTIEGIDITYSGCDSINPRTGHKLSWDIASAWDDAIKLANAIREVDMAGDIGAFDFFGPGFQTDGKGYKVLSVYNNIGTFGRAFLWGWRVNAFCQPEDQNLWRACGPGGAVAYEYDTLCNDGRCPCKTRDENGNCNAGGNDGIVNDPDKSYINIMFCDSFFAYPSLDEVINDGKNRPVQEKYNLNTYWDNRAKILFHELAHGSTVTKKVNDNLDVSDIWIKIKSYAKKDDVGTYSDEFEWIPAYGTLNSKILARTISDDNFDWVRRNDDNWSAYALAKYVESKIGVYPVLPLADGHTYDKSVNKPPQDATFLITSDGWMLNEDVYNRDTKLNPEMYQAPQGLKPKQSLEDLAFRPDSDYPDWYIKHLQDARNGTFSENTGNQPD